MATTKKAKTGSKASSSGAKKRTPAKKDAKAFVDLLHTDKKMRAVLKKGWDQVVSAGKKNGFKFTKQELHDHLKKRYKVTSLHEEDEPDTCVCI